MNWARFFLYLSLVLLPFGRLLDRPLWESAGKIAVLSPIEVVLVMSIVAYCGAKILRSQWPTSQVPGFKVIMLFPLWCVISLILNKIHYGLSMGATLFSGLYLVRWMAYCFLYFIAYEATSERAGIKKLAKWVLMGGVVFAAFGIVQVVFFPSDFALVLRPNARAFIDYDPQGRRLVSTILDPNIAAGFLLIPTIVALSFCIHGFRRWVGPLLLLIMALGATLSRGGAVGFVVGVTCLLWSSKSRRKTVLKAIAVLVILFIAASPVLISALDSFNKLTIEDESAQARLMEWGIALNAARDNWLIGIGFNTFGYFWDQYGEAREGGSAFGMSNDLILLLVLTGIVGFAIYFRMYGAMLGTLWELGSRGIRPWDRAFGRGVWAATLATVASSLFTSLMFYPHVMAILWILWALGRRLQDWARAQDRVTGRVLVSAQT